MRIAVDGRYIQDHFPGIARYTYNLVANVAELAEDEVTLYYNPSLPNTRYRVEELQRSGKVRLRHFGLATFSPWEHLSLPLRLLADKVEVFHSPYYVKPYVQPSRSVVTIYDVTSAVYPQYMPSMCARVGFELATRLAIASARIIVTLSRSSKNDLVSRYGVDPDKIAVTYLGVDARFQPREKGALTHVRQRYGLPQRFILYVGINKPHKNLVKLIEAFGASSMLDDVSLVIAGKEDKRYPEARLAARRSPAERRILFLEDVREEDLPYIYNLSDLFVFPSLYEGFGLPVLEAMASGLPIVCSNRSSLPEVVGEAGILVDPENVAEMSEAMARALEDDTLREQIRAKGLRRAKEFSWRETARQTLELYRRVAGC